MNGFNLEELIRISGGDPDFVKDMVDLFISQTESSLTDMEHCFDTGQIDKLFNVIHKMKPSVRVMGMELIYSGILEIEKMKQDLDNELLHQKTTTLSDQLRTILTELKKHRTENL